MAMQRRTTTSKRLAFIATGIVASAALAVGPGYAWGAGQDPEPPVALPGLPTALPAEVPSPAAPAVPTTPAAPTAPTAPTGTDPAPTPSPTDAGATAKKPAFGAYLAYGPQGVERMAELSKWLGGAELRVGHTYLPGDRWSNIAGAPNFLESWAEWRREKDDRLFVLNVPMMERNEDRVGDAEVRSLLRRGAEGEFDEHYRTLAERLVKLKVPDTVVVLGWEMNGITYTHRCGPDPEAWKKYWKRIVTTMRSVPGQKFKFDFTPNRGRDAIPWTQCYPGDDVVDIVGMDSYDQPSGTDFAEQVSEPYGLKQHVEFAKAHGKDISYPEWGLFRNGDNEDYMRKMLAWMDEHKPLYNTVTDYCPHGVWQCEDNPKSSKAYRTLLYGRTDTEPTAPEPTKPTTPPNCSPLNLGEWVEHWLGGKLCMRLDWFKRP
ncbi:glycoside hydrolase family 26 protein [Streptomyces sp. SYP-A7185]|uniref:glycoside hydrolase family 26 protein n=1 Tax=Streptomyces sp. SYP-A7185 TaxID=3040076 RepID=UPI0038F6215C